MVPLCDVFSLNVLVNKHITTDYSSIVVIFEYRLSNHDSGQINSSNQDASS